MRYVPFFSLMAAIALLVAANTVNGQSITQYGKAAWAAGTYPGGPNSGQYSQTYSSRPVTVYAAPRVAPAPVVASVPATTGRRAFSAEPGAPQAAAAATPAPAKVACSCGCCAR